MASHMYMHVKTFCFRSWQTTKVFQGIGASLSIRETFPPQTICNMWYNIDETVASATLAIRT